MVLATMSSRINVANLDSLDALARKDIIRRDNAALAAMCKHHPHLIPEDLRLALTACKYLSDTGIGKREP
jgi:hypothetical protein